MLTVVSFSILQHKIFYLLPHVIFTDSFSVGVVTRDKAKRLRENLTASF
jgi:hypothetical protein